MCNFSISLDSASTYLNHESEIYKKIINDTESGFTSFFKNYNINISSRFSVFKVTDSVSLLNRFIAVRNSHVENVKDITFIYIKNVLNPYIEYVSNLNLGIEKVFDKEDFLLELAKIRNELSKNLMTHDLKFKAKFIGKRKKVVNEEADDKVKEGSLAESFWTHVTKAESLLQEISKIQEKYFNVDEFLIMREKMLTYLDHIYQARSLRIQIKSSKEEGYSKVPKVSSSTFRWYYSVNKFVPIQIGEPLASDMQVFVAKVREFTALKNAPAIPVQNFPVPTPKYPQPFYHQGLPPIYPIENPPGITR